jgi:hypothetical protein
MHRVPQHAAANLDDDLDEAMAESGHPVMLRTRADP